MYKSIYDSFWPSYSYNYYSYKQAVFFPYLVQFTQLYWCNHGFIVLLRHNYTYCITCELYILTGVCAVNVESPHVSLVSGGEGRHRTKSVGDVNQQFTCSSSRTIAIKSQAFFHLKNLSNRIHNRVVVVRTLLIHNARMIILLGKKRQHC